MNKIIPILLCTFVLTAGFYSIALANDGYHKDLGKSCVADDLTDKEKNNKKKIEEIANIISYIKKPRSNLCKTVTTVVGFYLVYIYGIFDGIMHPVYTDRIKR